MESGVIFTDDIPVALQAKGLGKLKKARLWAYVRGGTGPPLTVYDFSSDRKKKLRELLPDQWKPLPKDERSLTSKEYKETLRLTV